MSTALYNRYRPATFAQVVGQEHVTDALRQALRTGRLHHAYLFSGPRGCGKTSSARILAASLNCIHGPTPEPCGVCDECVGIRTGASMDVTEIDAASHGLVDDARDLRERAFFAPASARFKVFVVDEAHMVTAAAFNALLKVVEEPPPYLKFVFATTEPDKVIATIRSRTHHYAFRLVPPGVLREHLASICTQEGVTVDPTVLPLVVRAGAGSVRDSLSVLDQLLAGADDEGLRYDKAVALLGVTDGVLLDDTVEALAHRDGAALFAVVDRVVSAGHDPRRFATDLLDRFRDLIVMAAVPDADARGLLESFSPDQIERMRTQAGQLGPAELSRTADILHAGLVEMRGTTSPRLMLELMLARALLPAAWNDPAALLTRLERLERQATIGAPPDGPQWSAPGPPGPLGPTRPAQPGPASPPTQHPQQARPATQSPPPTQPQPPTQPAAGGTGPAPGDVWSAGVAQPAGGAPPSGGERPAFGAGGPAFHPGAGSDSRPAHGGPAGGGAPGGTGTDGSGRIDAAGLRLLWDEILVLAGRRSRKTHAILKDHASVADVRGDEVVLAFATPTMGRMFGQGNNAELFCAALMERLGGTWRVTVAPAGGAGGGGFGGRSGPAGGGFPGSPGAPVGAGRTHQDQRPGTQRPAGPGTGYGASAPASAGPAGPAGPAGSTAPAGPHRSTTPAGPAVPPGPASEYGPPPSPMTGSGPGGPAAYAAPAEPRGPAVPGGLGNGADGGNSARRPAMTAGGAPGPDGFPRTAGPTGTNWAGSTDPSATGSASGGVVTAVRPPAPGSAGVDVGGNARPVAPSPGTSGTASSRYVAPPPNSAPSDPSYSATSHPAASHPAPQQAGPGRGPGSADGGGPSPSGQYGQNNQYDRYGQDSRYGQDPGIVDAPSLDDEDAPSHHGGARGGEEAAMSLLRNGLGATIIEQTPAS